MHGGGLLAILLARICLGLLVDAAVVLRLTA